MLEQQVRKTGFVDNTAKYFDFHKTLYNPTLTENDVYMKARDDALADMRASSKNIKPEHRGGAMYEQNNNKAEPDDRTISTERSHIFCQNAYNESDAEDFDELDPIQKRQKLEQMYKDKY